jgi:hypothetical protein
MEIRMRMKKIKLKIEKKIEVLPSRLKSSFIFTFSFLIFSLSTSFAPSLDAATISRPANNLGLVGYWTFDGVDMAPNVRDRSASGNHGNLSGQSATTTVIGRIGQSLLFDGTDDSISSAAANLDFEDTTPFTVSAWLKTSQTTGTILSTWELNVGSGWAFKLDGNGRPKMMLINTAGVTQRTGVAKTFSVHDGTWHHVVATYDGSQSVTGFKLYKDGVVDITISSGNSAPGALDNSSLFIGRTGGATPEFLNGQLDEVKVYNRTLTATEVAGLYNSGGARFSKSSSRGTLADGLVSHWTFDGSQMTPNVRDVSGQGMHANLIGQTSTTTVPGQIGQALKLDGVDDYAVDTANPFSAYPFTESIWIKAPTVSGQYTAISYANIASNVIYYTLGVNGNVPTQTIFSNLRSSAGDETSFSGSTQLAPGQWYMITLVMNSATDQKVYLNGVLDGSSSFSIPFVAGDNIAVGVTNRSSQFGFWPSALDDARFYNRALSASEIKQLYNMSATQKMNAPTTKAGTLSTGLIGYWTFDGKDMTSNVADVSGHANHGNLSGQTSTTTVLGKIGQALKFDGINDYVSAGDVPDADGTVISVSGWVKHEGARPATAECLITKIRSGFPGWELCRNNTSNAYNFTVSTDVTSATAISDIEYTDANIWHHIVGTYSGSEVRLYVDGLLADSTPPALTGTITDNGYLLCLGSWDNDCQGFSKALQGALDDVRVYNRVLSASEVKQLYNLGR